MVLADKRGSTEQILRGVLDEASQALQVKINDAVPVIFEGGIVDVNIQCADDSIALGDKVSGRLVTVTTDNRLRVDATGTFTGDTQIMPSTDFEVKTLTVTAVAQSITFSGIIPSSITVKARNINAGDIKIGKSNVASQYYWMSPGETLNIPLNNDSLVYFLKDVALGDCEITIFAVN